MNCITCSCFWTFLQAVGTILSAAIAFWALRTAKKAIKESQKMRKSSAFDALFSQLISNHKDVFKAECLQKPSVTKTDKAISSWFNQEQDAFTNFYNYYVSQPKVETTRQLADMWEVYKGSIDNSVHFSQACKYVYHEVCTVYNEESIDEKAKQHYIGIIQAMMNKHELFCYLVSLLQHFENYPEDKNDYREQLKQYNFFADIMRKHDPLYTDLMEHLCNQLYMDVSKIINI